MNKTIDIQWINLMYGYLALVIPFLLISYFKTGLMKAAMIAIVRMSVQLFFVGFYLEFLFRLDNSWVNVLWVLFMITLAAGTIINRSGVNLKIMFVPVISSLLVSIGFTAIWYIFMVIQPNNFFDPRFLLPIIGMMIGNSLRSNVVALSAYFRAYKKEQTLYRYALANGATHGEASMPFKREAISLAINPMIGQTAVMGLISLPGVLTGQILGGQDPSLAIKYQIVMVLSFFVMSILSLSSILTFASRFVFDNKQMLKKGVLKS